MQNLGTTLRTALVYITHLKALDERVKVGKNSRMKLLTLWSNLPTTGKNPLYSQLFLTRHILKDDPVFDDPLGSYLSNAGLLIKDHMLTLQGALNLTSDEIGCILTDAEKNLDTALLLLDNVSLLYRYRLLAEALKLPVCDLITLKGLSGLDPFKIQLAPITSLQQDYPFKQTLRFIEIVEEVKDRGFSVEDPDYLLCHHFDPVGKYSSKSDAIMALIKTLASEIRRIQDEHSVPADSNSITDDWLRQKLALMLPSDVADKFLSILTGTAENEVFLVNPTEKLDPKAIS
ncbi:MAG: hypothetical protein J5U19_15880 [Candidatus Methanoperedens sp.]|nr:hypothetical protein [Candidatus Methanoperedens sp.]